MRLCARFSAITNESHTLPELGVHFISLDYKESRRADHYGNQVRYGAKVFDAKGASKARDLGEERN
jgi:hypothetical protein